MQIRQRRQDCELCGCSNAVVVTEHGIETADVGVVRWVVQSRDCQHHCSMYQHGTCRRRSGSQLDLSRGELDPPIFG